MQKLARRAALIAIAFYVLKGIVVTAALLWAFVF